MEDLLPTDLLRTLETVTQEGGITAAADRLGRTQAAVSLQLKRLEARTGRTLIDRGARPMRPTADGEAVLRYARRILALNAACLAELGDRAVEGRLRIGIPADFAIAYLPKVLGRFAASYPNVSLEVSSDLSMRLTERMAGATHDLVLAIADQKDRASAAALWRDPVTWLSGPHGQAFSGTVPLVLYPRGCRYRARAEAALKSTGIPHRVVYSGAGLSGIQAAVESGLGITVLSKVTTPAGMRPLDPEGSGLPSLEPVDLGLYLPADGGNAAARALARFLRQELDGALERLA